MEKGRIVGKYGRKYTTNEAGMDHARIGNHLDTFTTVSAALGLDPIIVASGSVSAGRAFWRSIHGDRKEPPEQILAMLGSGAEFNAWQEQGALRGLTLGQILLTHHEINDTDEKGTLLKALNDSREHGVIPKINENDALSVTELLKLKYGSENDGIASHVARLVGADVLHIYKKRGFEDDDGKLVEHLTLDDEAWVTAMAEARSPKIKDDENGKGGIAATMEAGFRAARLGIEVAIIPVDFTAEQILAGEGMTHIAKAA